MQAIKEMSNQNRHRVYAPRPPTREPAGRSSFNAAGPSRYVRAPAPSGRPPLREIRVGRPKLVRQFPDPAHRELVKSMTLHLVNVCSSLQVPLDLTVPIRYFGQMISEPVADFKNLPWVHWVVQFWSRLIVKKLTQYIDRYNAKFPFNDLILCDPDSREIAIFIRRKFQNLSKKLVPRRSNWYFFFEVTIRDLFIFIQDYEAKEFLQRLILFNDEAYAQFRQLFPFEDVPLNISHATFGI